MAKCSKEQSLENQIIALEKKLKKLKKQKKHVHNTSAKQVSYKFSQKLIREATGAELKFKDIAMKKNLKLEFQYPIYIYENKQIVKFYIADFCDVENHIIFEVDGGYHFNDYQRRADHIRDKALRKQGYTVYRITNDEVMLGKSTELFYKAYMNIDPRFKIPI